MTSKLDRLSYASSCADKGVHLPSGEATQVSHIDYCNTISGDMLDNILVVPAFKHKLFSISQLTRQLNCSVNFFLKVFVLQDLFNEKVKEF